MAKQSLAKGGTSRVRFIMLEAEIAQGDLDQVASAIQNALKSTTIVQQRFVTHPAAPAVTSNGALGEVVQEELSDVCAEAEAARDVPRPTNEQRARKSKVPKVLDLDLTSGFSLERFATDHAPKTERERNLVVAAWFKEHRNEDEITSAHVYTCYRAMKWPHGIEDFSWPLRSLKKEQLMTSSQRGLYAINRLGLARVQDLKSE